MLYFFFFNDTATTEIYTLSLHDALPIWWPARRKRVHWIRDGRDRRRRNRVAEDRKSTRLNSSHLVISYAVFCLKKKKPARMGSWLCRYNCQAGCPTRLWIVVARTRSRCT